MNGVMSGRIQLEAMAEEGATPAAMTVRRLTYTLPQPLSSRVSYLTTTSPPRLATHRRLTRRDTRATTPVVRACSSEM